MSPSSILVGSNNNTTPQIDGNPLIIRSKYPAANVGYSEKSRIGNFGKFVILKWPRSSDG